MHANSILLAETYSVGDGAWHFVAFSFNDEKKRGIFVVDDKVAEFDTDDNMVFDESNDKVNKIVIGGSRFDQMENFQGSASCVQLYNAGLDQAEIHYRKDCKAAAGSMMKSMCETGYSYYDGVCYLVSEFPLGQSYLDGLIDSTRFPIRGRGFESRLRHQCGLEFSSLFD